MLTDRIDNPGHWRHDVYQRRVDRWIILIEVLILLLAAFLSIEVPDTAQGHDTSFRLLTMVRWFMALVAGAVAGSAVLLAMYGIYHWLKGT